jgi:pyruvate ferredoxin oxidoreductase delta subunit
MSAPQSERCGEPKCWRDVPPGTIAFGASSRHVETGLWRSMRPVLDAGKCVSCLRCWLQCPDSSVRADDAGKVCGIDLFFCKGCGICAEICPADAISMHPESEFAKNVNTPGVSPGSVGEFIG